MHYLHSIPGRLRVRTPALKGNERRAVEVKSALDALRGVSSCLVNTTTGSIVVSYDTMVIDADRILELLDQMRYFDGSRVISNDEIIHGAASKAGRLVGKLLIGAFVESALEGSVLAIVGALI